MTISRSQIFARSYVVFEVIFIGRQYDIDMAFLSVCPSIYPNADIVSKRVYIYIVKLV